MGPFSKKKSASETSAVESQAPEGGGIPPAQPAGANEEKTLLKEYFKDGKAPEQRVEPETGQERQGGEASNPEPAGDLMAIFTSEEAEDQALGVLGESLEVIDIKSLVVQARNILGRLKEYEKED